MKYFLLTLSLISFCSFSQRNREYKLDTGWVFSQENYDNWLPATVPGEVHMDLLENGLIEEPFKGNNEQELSWVGKENWVYKRTINVDDTLLMNEHIDLIFKGLDTYSTIYINDKKVLETDNMFKEWVLEVKPYLVEGENILKILFKSPMSVNKSKVESAEYELPSGNETVDLKVSSYTRKAAFQFGWDFCPRFITAGIWRDIRMKTWNDAYLKNVFVSTKEISESSALLNFQFEIFSDENNQDDYHLFFKDTSIQISLSKGENIVNQVIQVNNPKLWYPNGYGSPEMYFSQYRLRKNEIEIESNYFRYAIRQIELIQDADSIGTSFYFKVNNVPIFIKGANYIPQDIFLSRVSPIQYNKLIKQVNDANMNMLRVWGGGIYEDDYFYEQCDYNGILVWQDFMFANSMYPKDEEFKQNIKEEVAYNIKRLRNHPCIALWCGNNEIEVAWNNWGWQEQFGYTAKDSTEIWENYKEIFHEMIPTILTELDQNAEYVSTSPLSNWGTKDNFNHSSMHYWGVWHGKDSLESYADNVGRFMAEYGFQSYPEINLLGQYLQRDDLNLQSEAMKNRQKSYVGNSLIHENIIKYFGNADNFKTWCSLSQKVQAKALNLAIQSHRLSAPHCMGTLIWQLNDCWPGPSWSLIDYSGKPKQAYWLVKNKYSSIAAFPRIEDNNFVVSIVSDEQTTFEGSLKIAYRHKGENVLEQTSDFFSVSALENTTCVSIKLSDLDAKYGLENLSANLRIFNRESGKRIYRENFDF